MFQMPTLVLQKSKKIIDVSPTEAELVIDVPSGENGSELPSKIPDATVIKPVQQPALKQNRRRDGHNSPDADCRLSLTLLMI